MGEQARGGLRALSAAGVKGDAYDIYRHAPRDDPDMRSLVLPIETSTLPRSGVRIFHINGDEVDDVIKSLDDRGLDFRAGYNVIVPAWELPRYPAVWSAKLKLFDEVWALSSFIREALAAAGIDSVHVGQSVENAFGYYLPRRYFGIRESAFVLLCFLDLQSYPSRKNPRAVLELYRELRRTRPLDDVQLVLKVRAGELPAQEIERELDIELPRDVVLLNERYDTFTIRSLIACCDCLVSLHRSEGFGRGMAEAMLLGRLALATGWSGNCDYMAPSNSLLVDYELVKVKKGEYPQSAGQSWAQPDPDHALDLLCKVIDGRTGIKSIVRQARADVIRVASNRAVGIRMLNRLEAIFEGRGWRMA